jgi:uncharacterized protein YlxW (UPF0749 family)
MTPVRTPSGGFEPSVLDTIAANALDDDYYEVRPGRYARSRGWVAAAVLVLFGVMVTIAVVQTRDESLDRQVARETLVADIQSRRETLSATQATQRDLRSQVAALRAAAGDDDPDYSALQVIAADRAVDGPGVVVRVDDASDAVRVTDRDLRLLVNGLWGAGAEAVAVDGRRIGTLSAIHEAGGAITVNYAAVNPPYRVEAIGDSRQLADAFADGPFGEYWQIRQDEAGLKYDMQRAEELSLPAVPGERVRVRHAKVWEGTK